MNLVKSSKDHLNSKNRQPDFLGTAGQLHRLKEGIDLPIITLDELMERDFGDLEGKVVGKENYELMKNGNVRGLEKLPDLEKRSVNAILNIYKDNKDSNVLLFTHSQIIKGLLSHLVEDFDFTCMLDNSSLNFFEVDY